MSYNIQKKSMSLQALFKNNYNKQKKTLREKCLHTEFFLVGIFVYFD